MDNTKNAGINKELKFDDAVIAKIVGITCNEVEGVYSLEGGMMANMTDLFRKDEDPTGNFQQSYDGNRQECPPNDRT